MSAPAAYPAQLQINTTGAWRNMLPVDLGGIPKEFFDKLDDVLRMSATGERATARMVATRPGPNGAPVATTTVMMLWTRKEGWVNT